jgi:glycosyltransferase involved in cell wall biosynthesis
MISVVVITLNEADRISALLKSAAFAHEVIVVDSGSTDGTQEICGSHGARVVTHPWQGFAVQKQFAMDLASSEWILNLDADERISGPLAAEIQEAIQNAPPEICGFSMPRLSRYLGEWIRHGGWYPDRKIRLIRKGSGQWKGSSLHEKLEVSGKIQPLSGPILHEVYRNIGDQVKTINRFSDVFAQAHPPTGAWFVAAGVFHALGKFAECYFWKLGILDGVAGLVIAMNSAWYVFLKHAKVWEKGLNNPAS